MRSTGIFLSLCATLLCSVEQAVSAGWKRIQLTSQYYAEGASIGDINRDGKPDVIAGPFWFEGPDFTRSNAFYKPVVADVNAYAFDHFFNWAYDFNGDGWLDILVVGFPGAAAHLFIHPKQSGAPWEKFMVHATVDNESPEFLDLTGDGKPELLCMSGGRIGYLAPGPDPTRPWMFHAVSPEGPWQRFTHGLGAGDVNGDGRMDILEKDGWWEQPPAGSTGTWKHHPAKFGTQGGAQMHAYDVDGDGDQDVISSLWAHGFGLSWWEQQQENGVAAWKEHVIMNAAGEDRPGEVKFSQLHALRLADVNGDGLMDILTGKCWWAHGPKMDPDPNHPAVLYWFELKRTGGTVRWVPHLIDQDSGTGRQLYAGDLDGNKKLDLVIGNKKGIFVFLQ